MPANPPVTVAAVEKTDLTTGKIARAFSGVFDILNEGPNENTQNRRPCRYIYSTGAVTITGLDDVDVILPAGGGEMVEWKLQAKAIVLGIGIVEY